MSPPTNTVSSRYADTVLQSTAIAGLGAVVAPVPAEAPCDDVYHQFVVRTRRREALQEHLAAQKIASAIHYPVPIHRSRAFADLSGGDDVAPTATRLASEICSLPIFPSMTERQIERIGDAVAEFSLTVADLAA